MTFLGIDDYYKGDLYMATYTLSLTPALINLGTEGSLDTSILNGVSTQRTGYVQTTVSGNLYSLKVTEVNDGGVFTDTPEVLGDLSWINN